jgi:hypothetical protein
MDKKLIPNIGLSYSSYKLNELADRENAVAAALGVIARPCQMLSVDVQGQWVTNPIYKTDFRLYAGLNFWISQKMNLFE